MPSPSSSVMVNSYSPIGRHISPVDNSACWVALLIIPNPQLFVRTHAVSQGKASVATLISITIPPVQGGVEGLPDGANVVGFMLGSNVGDAVGSDDVGSEVVGFRDGANDVGCMLGSNVGDDDVVGSNDVGSEVVGFRDGANDVGLMLGCNVGIVVGSNDVGSEVVGLPVDGLGVG